MVETLKANEEIGGNSDVGGFSLPPEGNIAKGRGVLMEFTGEIKLCGDAEDCLMFVLSYADDPSAKANIFCKVSTQAGLSKIVGIGRDSGVFDRIDKKRLKANKTPIQSSDGKVKVKVLTDPKFHEQMRKEIEGCSVLCSINHTEAKPYKDKDTGEEKEGYPNANISKIASAKNGQVNAAQPSQKSSEGDDGDDDEFG